MQQLAKTSVENGIAVVAVDNPPVNALSTEAFGQLARAVRGFLADARVRGIVLTGEGAHFSAGADIQEIARASDAAGVEPLQGAGRELLDLIASADLPVIAAVRGHCLGGGCELAMACPLRVAGEGARFGQPEIRLGIMPGLGGTQRLPRLAGRARALEMLLTGDAITASEALQIGLVNLVVPDAEVRRQAVELAAAIGKMSKVAVAGIMRAFREGMERPLQEGLDLEAGIFGGMMSAEDKRIGIKAFLEKDRRPRFVDR